MRAVKYDDVPVTEFGLRGGAGSAGIKTLIEGSAADSDNFGLYLQELDDAFFTPRHRHNFDQFRIALDGPYSIAPHTDLNPGEVAYFPEGAYYGPQNGTPGTVVLSLHFTGPSQCRYINLQELGEGLRALKGRGTVTNGVFTEITPEGTKRNQDSYEAVWEQLEGRTLQYPRPRYAAPVVIQPGEFKWKPLNAGVEVKYLGTFTEYEAGIRMYRIDANTGFSPSADAHRCVLIVLEGGLEHADKTYGKYSCFLIDAGESCVFRTGQHPTRVFAFLLPNFSD